MSTRNISVFLSILLVLMFACGSSASNETPILEENNSPAQPTDVPPTLTAEPTPIQHFMIPSDLPEIQSGTVGDQDSSITADQKRAPSGDRFTFSRYERPFNANTMDIYYPAFDIQGALFYEDDTWFYAVLNFKNDNSSYILNGKYGFEIDLNVDGGGDWLILVSQPTSTDWSTKGVEIWFDTDDDVGGTTPMSSDNVLTDGNGYETFLFSENQGDDPDLAWGRISPDDPYTVQLAVKRSLLQGDTSFLVGLWAGTEDFNPALFDFNDHYTHEQAGTALTELEYFYPVKEISELDNTCRMAIGFQPTGNEPGVCPQPPKPGQEPPSASCAPQYVYCINFGSQTVCYCLQP